MSEKNNQCANLINKIESNLYIFTKFPIIGLLVISIIAIFIRLLFLDTELPIRQDANAYFWYAMDMSILNQFPSSGHTNDGWSIFLSFFFSIFNFNNYLDYTILQRIITIVISVITIIPIYFLAKKFVSKEASILAGALFIFEPHIIQNSLQGLTEPLYIFLITLSLVFFLTNDIRFRYLSFAIIALSTIVRAEGITMLIIMSITFFILQKRDKEIIKKYVVAILIFGLIFGTMMFIKIESSGIENSAIGFMANVGAGFIIDSDNIPMEWEDVFVNMVDQGREITPLKAPIDLRKKLRDLKWLPTKDKENVHHDFVTLMKTLNTLWEQPFLPNETYEHYSYPATNENEVTTTFCGT